MHRNKSNKIYTKISTIKNNKTLLREILRCRNMQYSWRKELNVVKMPILFKLIYRAYAILTKYQQVYCVREK